MVDSMTAPPGTAKLSDRTWQQLLEAGQMERHFNQLQASYRALASTWLLATFAGIGFIVVNAKSIPIDWLAAATGVAVAGAIGIAMVWSLDLLVYHRLLDVIFFTARQIEIDHAEQPPFRIHMLRVFSHVGVVGHVKWFYILAADLLIAIGTLTASVDFADHQWAWPIATAGGLIVITATTLGIRLTMQHYQSQMLGFFGIKTTKGRSAPMRWSPVSETWTQNAVEPGPLPVKIDT